MARARTASAKEKRRQHLLDAALDEFFESGFAAARMDDIARRAGVSKGTIYLYFDSKEQVFNELIDAIASPNILQLETVLAQSDSIEHALKMLFSTAAKIVRSSPLPRLVKILVGDCNGFPEAVQRYRELVIERGLAAVENILTVANQTGELEVQDPKLTARLFVAPVIFAGIWRVVFERQDEQPLDIEKLLQLHCGYMLRALAPREDQING